jgi:hypothetical protein
MARKAGVPNECEWRAGRIEIISLENGSPASFVSDILCYQYFVRQLTDFRSANFQKTYFLDSAIKTMSNAVSSNDLFQIALSPETMDPETRIQKNTITLGS